jgi:hypothetical protein
VKGCEGFALGTASPPAKPAALAGALRFKLW